MRYFYILCYTIIFLCTQQYSKSTLNCDDVTRFVENT